MWIQKVCRVNQYASLCLNILISLLLIYLILAKTDKHMRHYSRLMLVGVFVDLLAGAMYFATGLEVDFSEGYLFLRSGWALPGRARLWMLGLCQCSIAVSVSSAAIQCIYRHFLIQKKKTIPFYVLGIYYGVVSVLSTAPIVYSLREFVLVRHSATATDAFLKLTNWLDDNDVLDSFHFIELMSFSIIADFLAFCALLNVLVALIVVFNRKMRIFFADAVNNTTCSPQTIDLQKQLNRQLKAKLVVPSASALLIASVMAIFFFSPSYSGGMVVALLTPVPWIFVANSLTSILCIKKYRTSVWKMLRSPKSNVITVHVSKASNAFFQKSISN